MGCGSSHSVGIFPYPSLPEALSSRYFVSESTGLLIAHRSWRPSGRPTAVVYLVHGYAEHSVRVLMRGGWGAAVCCPHLVRPDSRLSHHTRQET